MADTETMLTELWGTGYRSLCGATNGSDFHTIGHFDDPEALLDRAAEATAKGANVWWSVHPMASIPSLGRGIADDITEVVSLVVDADWQAPGAHADNDKLPTETEVRAAFAKLEIAPSYTVNSGHGFQCYWLLDAPVTPEAGAVLHARLHARLEQLGIDTDRGDLASILRVPGSVNFKTDPVEVTIEEAHPERRYTPEYLKKRLPYAKADPAGSGSGPVKSRGLDKVVAALEAVDRHQDAEALRVLVDNYGGHDPYLAGDNSVHVTRPGKTAGNSATVGYATPGVIKMWSSGWKHAEGTFTKQAHYLVGGVDGTSIVSADTGAIFKPATDNADDEPLTLADRIRARLLTTEQLRQLPPPQPLIDGWLNLNSLAMMFGSSGAGKSHVAIDIAMTVGARRFWHSNDVTNGPVLYVVAEGTPGASLRSTAWETHHDTTSNVIWHPGSINVFDDAWASALAEVVADLKPVLVVIDTYARSTVGMGENDTKDTGITVEHLDMIRNAAECCVLIVHHAGKDTSKGARGNTSLKGAMDTEIEVIGTENRITVKNSKQKDAAEAPNLYFRLEPVPDTDSVVIVQAGRVDPDELPNAAFDTLAALRAIDVPEGVAATAWKAAADIADRTFYRHRSGLLAQGHVVNVGTDKQPRYRPAEPQQEPDEF